MMVMMMMMMMMMKCNATPHADADNRAIGSDGVSVSMIVQYEHVFEREPRQQFRRIQRHGEDSPTQEGVVGDGDSNPSFDADGSAWWRAINESVRRAEGAIRVVLVAPVWSGEALTLAREMKSMSGRLLHVGDDGSIDDGMVADAGAANADIDIQFTWISDQHAVSELRRSLCYDSANDDVDSVVGMGRVPDAMHKGPIDDRDDHGDGSRDGQHIIQRLKTRIPSTLAAKNTPRGNGDSVFTGFFGAIMKGTTAALNSPGTEQRNAGDEEPASVPDMVNTPLPAAKFIDFGFPSLLILKPVGSRSACRSNGDGSTGVAGQMSRYVCYPYRGSWRARHLVMTLAKSVRRTVPLSTDTGSAFRGVDEWNSQLFVATPKSRTDIDSLRSSYEFVVVAYVNCESCAKAFRRRRNMMDHVTSDADFRNLYDEMKSCRNHCQWFRREFEGLSRFLGISHRWRLAVIDVTRLYHDGRRAAASAGREGQELLRAYYMRDFIGGAVNDVDYSDEEASDRSAVTLMIHTRHGGSSFAYSLDDEGADESDAAHRLRLWVLSCLTEVMGSLDKDGQTIFKVDATHPRVFETTRLSVAQEEDIETVRREDDADGEHRSHGNEDRRRSISFVLFADETFSPTRSEAEVVEEDGSCTSSCTVQPDGERPRPAHPCSDFASALTHYDSHVDVFKSVAEDFRRGDHTNCDVFTGGTRKNVTSDHDGGFGNRSADLSFNFMPSTSFTPLRGSFSHWLGIRSLPAIAGIVYDRYSDSSPSWDQPAGAPVRHIGNPGFHTLELPRSFQPPPRDQCGHVSGQCPPTCARHDVEIEVRRFICGVVLAGSNGIQPTDVGVSRDIREMDGVRGRNSHCRDVRQLSSTTYSTMVRRSLSAPVAIQSETETPLSTLLLLHRPGCAFCSRARAVMSHMSREVLAGDTKSIDLDVAMLDCEASDCRRLHFLESVADVFPRILLFMNAGSGEPFVYEGPLNSGSILAFVHEVHLLYSNVS